MIIEVRTFRTTCDEETFLTADHQEQHDLQVRNRGLVRRSTARGDNGEWLVLTLWGSREAIEEPSAALSACIDGASIAVDVYEDIGG